MSQINFAALKAESPRLDKVWDQFSQWRNTHRNHRIIDPKALARYMQDITADDLLSACRVMVHKGMLRPAFIIESPDGQLLGKPFDNPREAPASVNDGFEGWVSTADAFIVPIFEVSND